MEAPHEPKLDGCCHFLVFRLFTPTAAGGSRCVLEVGQKAAQMKTNSFNIPSTDISSNVLPLTPRPEDLCSPTATISLRLGCREYSGIT